MVKKLTACWRSPATTRRTADCQWLCSEAPGLLGSKRIKWNFTKFLVGKDGQVRKRYAPTDTPESLKPDLDAALAA